MPVLELNHVTVRAGDMEGTRDFYVRVLGMSVGPRPDLGFPGYWLYCGGKAAVHLVPESGQLGAGGSPDTGNFDHIAFLGGDFDEFRRHLGALGITFRENAPPNAALRQLFFRDPNDVMLEINFPTRPA